MHQRGFIPLDLDKDLLKFFMDPPFFIPPTHLSKIAFADVEMISPSLTSPIAPGSRTISMAQIPSSLKYRIGVTSPAFCSRGRKNRALVDRSIFSQAFLQLDSDTSRPRYTLQNGLIFGGSARVPLRELVESVEFESVEIEGVRRSREGGRDTENTEVRKKKTSRSWIERRILTVNQKDNFDNVFTGKSRQFSFITDCPASITGLSGA